MTNTFKSKYTGEQIEEILDKANNSTEGGKLYLHTIIIQNPINREENKIYQLICKFLSYRDTKLELEDFVNFNTQIQSGCIGSMRKTKTTSPYWSQVVPQSVSFSSNSFSASYFTDINTVTTVNQKYSNYIITTAVTPIK